MAKKSITPKNPKATTTATQTDDASAAKTGRSLTRKTSAACVKH